jgi:NarL family two-component system response regulator LiaR
MSEVEPIRVMIVDDHAVVRSGLAAFLEAYEELLLVGQADSGEAALRLCAACRPDVVLMDLVMPGMDGATATRELLACCPGARVVVLTSFHDEALVQGALHAGAIGYLLKNVGAAELAHAIQAAHAGQPTLATEATRALIHAARHEGAPGAALTPREREVLALMVDGHSNPVIAQRLVISRATVKFHVSNILSKLGAGSRAEAVAQAVRHNF